MSKTPSDANSVANIGYTQVHFDAILKSRDHVHIDTTGSAELSAADRHALGKLNQAMEKKVRHLEALSEECEAYLLTKNMYSIADPKDETSRLTFSPVKALLLSRRCLATFRCIT